MIELLRLIQLDPVACPVHDRMGKALSQPMETEGRIVVGCHDRQLGSCIAVEPWIGIEPQHLPKYPHYGFPRGGPEIGKQSLPNGTICSRDSGPVPLNRGFIVGVECLKKRLGFRVSDLLTIADRIYQKQSDDPLRMSSAVHQRRSATHAMTHQHELIQTVRRRSY